jgi:uncharacterized membrane protein YjjB (DUF3815 family)
MPKFTEPARLVLRMSLLAVVASPLTYLFLRVMHLHFFLSIVAGAAIGALVARCLMRWWKIV